MSYFALFHIFCTTLILHAFSHMKFLMCSSNIKKKILGIGEKKINYKPKWVLRSLDPKW